tara:strand:- start:1742 stop:2572 length:831 start_codon:yes stop_codon:yes gene_type:complete
MGRLAVDNELMHWIQPKRKDTEYTNHFTYKQTENSEEILDAIYEDRVITSETYEDAVSQVKEKYDDPSMPTYISRIKESEIPSYSIEKRRTIFEKRIFVYDLPILTEYVDPSELIPTFRLFPHINIFDHHIEERYKDTFIISKKGSDYYEYCTKTLKRRRAAKKKRGTTTAPMYKYDYIDLLEVMHSVAKKYVLTGHYLEPYYSKHDNKDYLTRLVNKMFNQLNEHSIPEFGSVILNDPEVIKALKGYRNSIKKSDEALHETLTTIYKGDNDGFKY